MKDEVDIYNEKKNFLVLDFQQINIYQIEQLNQQNLY